MPSNKKLLQAAAGNAGESLYVEDVFSTYLYDGTATTNNIVNGVDLTEGGLVWIKTRDDVEDHNLVDSERGSNKGLESNTTDAETGSAGFSTFNSDGFTLTGGFGKTNSTSSTYASWTFRKAEKFFDVVTYTGDDVSGREIAHNLGSTPGFMIVKKTSGTYNWQIYHSSIGATKFLEFTNYLAQTSSAVWDDTAPTDSVFTVGNEYGVNQSGDTYVAYLFASDAGGFGDDGDESIIKCGSYVGSGDTAPYVVSVDLGFEPQWLLVKNVTTGGAGKNWLLVDMMRGFHATGADKELRPNTSDAENDSSAFNVTSTGFSSGSGGEPNIQGNTYIYIAIRRPMKTPESGTEVFAMDTQDSTDPAFDSPFPPDMALRWFTSGGSYYPQLASRLTGNKYQVTHVSTGEYSDTFWNLWGQDGVGTSGSDNSNVFCSMFKRATGFFDVVAYTGDGTSNRSINHNLAVTPELIIGRVRSGQTDYGGVWQASLGNQGLYLSFSNSAGVTLVAEGHTSSIFKVSDGYGVNNVSTLSHIAYLFGSVDGVSKVGSYTGTGSNVNVDCGFSTGARFILIKRTDSSGGWHVWDSARGIIAGNDPYFLLNSSAAEVTSTDYIDPLASGFTVTSSAPAALNASGGTYIFLAIA